MALAWLYTGANAYIAIRDRDVEAHRRWMIRNYALTYAGKKFTPRDQRVQRFSN